MALTHMGKRTSLLEPARAEWQGGVASRRGRLGGSRLSSGPPAPGDAHQVTPAWVAAGLVC